MSIGLTNQRVGLNTIYLRTRITHKGYSHSNLVFFYPKFPHSLIKKRSPKDDVGQVDPYFGHQYLVTPLHTVAKPRPCGSHVWFSQGWIPWDPFVGLKRCYKTHMVPYLNSIKIPSLENVRLSLDDRAINLVGGGFSSPNPYHGCHKSHALSKYLSFPHENMSTQSCCSLGNEVGVKNLMAPSDMVLDPRSHGNHVSCGWKRWESLVP